MDYTTKSPSLQRFTRAESDWVFYQMRRKGITRSDIAELSLRSLPFVSQVLGGTRSSLPVYDALRRLLGYGDINALLAEAGRSST